jgi:hypothetical protein
LFSRQLIGASPTGSCVSQKPCERVAIERRTGGLPASGVQWKIKRRSCPQRRANTIPFR